MRPRDNSRNKKQPKAPASLIEDESKKIQERLEQLRRQVQSKKNAKASMNSTESRFGKQQTKEIARFLNTASDKMAKKPMETPKSELTQFYCELKMEHLEDTLKGAGIKNKQDLNNLTELEIQKLPIPPGFRIKLKKALIKKTAGSENKDELDIEAIIEKRSKQKQKELTNRSPSKFTALDVLVEEEDVFSFNTYEDGGLIKGGYEPDNQIQNSSFLETIRGRKLKGQYVRTDKEYMECYYDHSTLRSQPLKSCLKQRSQEVKKLKIKKQVKFRADVVGEGQIGHLHKKYPKEGFTTGVQMPNSNDNIEAPPKLIEFCNGCFKPIKQKTELQQLLFCSQKCLNQYKQTLIKCCINCAKQVKVADLVLYEDLLVCSRCAEDFQALEETEEVDLEF